MCHLVHVPIKQNSFFFFFFFHVVVFHGTSQGTASIMYQVYNTPAKALCYVLFRDRRPGLLKRPRYTCLQYICKQCFSITKVA